MFIILSCFRALINAYNATAPRSHQTNLIHAEITSCASDRANKLPKNKQIATRNVNLFAISAWLTNYIVIKNDIHTLWWQDFLYVDL